MILYAGYQYGKGKYLIYSNMDIGLQPPFYIKIARQLQVQNKFARATAQRSRFCPSLPVPQSTCSACLIQVMPNVPISTIREEFEHVDASFDVQDAIARRGTGLSHPGHDCWAFPRDWVPKLILGFTLIGVSMIATDLMQVWWNQHARAPPSFRRAQKSDQRQAF